MTDFFDDGMISEEKVDSADPSSGGGPLMGDPSKVVTARGTEDGLILRIDGRSEWGEILGDLEKFLGGRRKFFEGGEVSVEWLERLPTKEQSKELEELLREHYGIGIVTRRKRPTRQDRAKDQKVDTQHQKKRGGVTIPLFDEVGDGKPMVDLTTGRPSTGLADKVEAFSASPFGGSNSDLQMSEGDRFSPKTAQKRYYSNMAKLLGEDAYYEDDANAKVVFGTLRSGQRYETPFSLVVVGDVNPGADLIAGGDIVVLGSLRGTAHASAYDDDSLHHVIIALHMQPMQLRIGSVISRGSDEVGRGAEIARIDNRRIIVEPFNPRALMGKRLR